jgi:hypothetical protein
MADYRPEPRPPEGKARQVQAMVEGPRRWVERMKAKGTKFPGGRKSGQAWMTIKMRERLREKASTEARRLGCILPFDAPDEVIRRLSELADMRVSVSQRPPI